MDQITHMKILSFIWGIADDDVRDQITREREGKVPGLLADQVLSGS